MLTCLMLVCSALYAQPPTRKYEFEIGKVSLSEAIRLFSMSTGLQILYLPESETEELQIVGPVTGSFTPAEALTKLLEPTGLAFSWVNDRTIGIERPPPPPPPPPKPAAEKGSNATGRREQKRETPAPTYRHPGLIGTMLVPGTMIKSIDDGTGQVLTFDRSDIERMGASTVADVFRNISQQTYMRPEGFRPSGAQYAELRGLGSPDLTLVLINGRRTFPSAANITTNAFDLNTIPLPAVERIEVLPDSASTAYGTDAIGGVVNILLRENIPEPVAELHYGTADGGAGQRRLSLSGGHRREGSSSAFVFDYFETEQLIGSERERWRDQDFRRFGGVDHRLLNSSPGNIASIMPGNLPGLNAPVAAVPEGSTGNTLEDFVATAGRQNRQSFFSDLAIVQQVRRFSAAGFANAKVSESVTASAEVLYVDRSIDFQIPPAVLVGVAAPTNPYNVFGVPVLVQGLFTDIGPQNQNIEAKLLRAVAALHGRSSSWRWELSVLDTQEDAWIWADNSVDQRRVNAALAQSDPNLALDVFNDGPVGSPELLASLIADRDVELFRSDGRQVAAVLGGPLFRLPAGEVTAALGGEWRREAAEFNTAIGSFDRNITAAFADVRIPLLDSRMQVPAVEELSVTVAGRWDRYDDSAEVFNPQYGLIWKPRRDVTFRAAHARTFRPPSLHELHAPKVSVQGPVSDPRRPGQPGSATFVSGGNPDLTSVEGDLLTAGLTFAPSAVAGLNVTTSYWRVEMDDRIPLLTSTFLLANEAALPERVIRGAPTPADIAAGRPGPLLVLDISRGNLGRLRASGLDLNLAYDFKTGFGRFTPSLSATWIDEYETVDLPGASAQNRVNVANELGSIVRWRVVGSLGWDRGPLSAFITARYVPSYDDTVAGLRTGRVLPSHATLDVQASLDLGGFAAEDSFWRGLKLTLGAVNVTDELPHFAEVNGAAGFDLSQGDLKGRFCFARLGKAF